MRRTFADELYKQMVKNEDIFLLTGDLGYKMWDQVRDDFPKRFLNCGASEQSMLDIAVGLALKDKIPFCYSITPFLLWRPAETIRLYLNHENIPVHLIGSGRDADYEVDGFSHNAEDIKGLLINWPNIETYFPEEKKEIPIMVEMMIKHKKPSFISLQR